MSKTYKIWAVIEEYDHDTDESKDLEAEVAEVGAYDTLEEAQEAIRDLDQG
jgi:hypothetical protein